MRNFFILLLVVVFSCTSTYEYEFKLSTLDFETKQIMPNISFYITDKYGEEIYKGITDNDGFAKVALDVNSTYVNIYLRSQEYNLQLTQYPRYPELFKIATPTTTKTNLYLAPK